MSKSLCIKSNNPEVISYLLNEFDYFDINNVYFSCYKFKNYTNIIVHYKGKNIISFLSSISKTLSFLVLDLYENLLIKNIISSDYFYFTPAEQKSILSICINSLNYEESVDRLNFIQSSFFTYLLENKSINLSGFINFRLCNYIKYLDKIIDICVNKFIIDKEYLEFVNLLKSYVLSSKGGSNVVHLIYQNKESVLLDDEKNIIPMNDKIFKAHYLSDITFSSNDYALNSLLTLLPHNLYIHLLDAEDEFINTLKLIFDDRVHICHNCNICRLYNKANIQNKMK